MLKATSTYTQARNIVMALTMSFAATTMVTACGSDENADTTASPEVEMSSENQNNMVEDNTQIPADTEDSMTDEPDTTMASEETDSSATSDETSSAQVVESESEGPETHIVMAQGLIFDPLVVKINPGDTVAWRKMSTHNSESIDGLIPEGAEKWNSPMSQNFERTFTQEGIYIYKCTPHFGAGMGGAIIVGEPVNLEQIKNADVSGAGGRLVRKAISAVESM